MAYPPCGSSCCSSSPTTTTTPAPADPWAGEHRPTPTPPARKQHPSHNPRPTWRIREDTVDSQGRITLRRANKLHHIGLGYQHTGKHVRAIISELDIIIDTATGQILRELQLDPDKDYQPTGRPPGPPKGTLRQGGRQKRKP